ncbi:hypothetical protein LTR62_003122 [Meristemomyces frigidus]|uniref:E3 ubiquitin-protein ligase n=1 Tax=Meristemomyces frigidus TaxID=1508187 RepID=A0AAN7TLP9_9PEZI|nr:hypothetical protein LTR62_003122 [Meristemomyces frigidus]
MAVSLASEDGITLRGHGEDANTDSIKAVMFRLDGRTAREIQKTAQLKEKLQFLTGSTPRLRIGSRTVDLTISHDEYCNELYASSSPANLTYAGHIVHRAVLKRRSSSPEDGDKGTSEALATLQRSLATYEQERQAKQTGIHNAVVPEPNNRGAAFTKAPKKFLRGELNSGRPSPISTPLHGPAPTSAYVDESDVRQRAVKLPLIHLLAIKPLSSDGLFDKLHAPRSELESLLPKVARDVDGTWKLTDRSYKELDVWKFSYKSKEDRQLAVDNAIRAYDRLRIGREEQIWQLLLPQKERGKGTILSRLQTNRALTPVPQASNDVRPGSAAGTPRIGASTPRSGTPKVDAMKKILNKKKTQAVDEAKEKKRKEAAAAKEAAALDRESDKRSKVPAKKKADPKVKSAETVHSSEEESGEEGEVRETETAMSRVDSKLAQDRPKAPKARASASPEDSDTADVRKTGTPSTRKQDPAKSIAALASKTVKPAAGKATPHTTNNLSAPSSQRKAARSPSKTDTRPNVPSPLGAARPRVASDVSDRNAAAIQRSRQGAATPRGLGITNGGIRKRHDTVTSTDSAISSVSEKKTDETQGPKPSTNGALKITTSGVKTPQTNSMKRKTEDPHPAAPGPKHRKPTPDSSQPQKPRPTPNIQTQQPTSQPSPTTSTTFNSDSSSSDNNSVLDLVTYAQGVALAEKFRDQYYPAYAALYDAQAAAEAKGEVVGRGERERLWAMHRRLEQMKREIGRASKREAGEGE